MFHYRSPSNLHPWHIQPETQEKCTINKHGFFTTSLVALPQREGLESFIVKTRKKTQAQVQKCASYKFCKERFSFNDWHGKSVLSLNMLAVQHKVIRARDILVCISVSFNLILTEYRQRDALTPLETLFLCLRLKLT